MNDMKILTDLLDKYNQRYEIVGDKVVGGDVFLYNRNLTTLPESIGNLECIWLHLDCNNLTTLPKLNENIKVLSIDDFNDLTNLLYLPNLSQLWIDNKYFDKESLSELLNEIRHQKVMNDMNKILEII